MANNKTSDLKEFREKHWDKSLPRNEAYKKYLNMYPDKTSDLKEEQIQLEIEWLRSHFCSDVPNERELREVAIEIIQSREEAIRKTQEATETKLGNELLKKFGIESVSSNTKTFRDLLKVVYQELEIVVKDNMKLRSLQQLEELQSKLKRKQEAIDFHRKKYKEAKSKINKLERKINCVKNHQELKPINCCYQADTLEYKSYKEIAEKKIKELK